MDRAEKEKMNRLQSKVDELEADRLFNQAMHKQGEIGLRNLFQFFYKENRRLQEELSENSIEGILYADSFPPSTKFLPSHEIRPDGQERPEEPNVAFAAAIKLEGRKFTRIAARGHCLGDSRAFTEAFRHMLETLGLWIQTSDVTGENLLEYGITDGDFIAIANELSELYIFSERDTYNERRKELRHHYWEQHCKKYTGDQYDAAKRKKFSDLFNLKCENTLANVAARTNWEVSTDVEE